MTSTGVIECREALAYPGDPHLAVVLRRIVAVDGPARVRVVLDLRAGFGRYRMTQAQGRPAGSGRPAAARSGCAGRAAADATVRADGRWSCT